MAHSETVDNRPLDVGDRKDDTLPDIEPAHLGVAATVSLQLTNAATVY